MNIKLGCDPECFLIDTENKYRSSIGKIGGSKISPMPLPIGPGYCVQEDNVAIEFNIPPAEGRSQFVESINLTLDFLKQEIQSRFGYTLSPVSAVSFDDEELQDPRALEFGCEPDFNAWTEDVNPKPKAEDVNLRSCGGHVHVGFDKTKADKLTVIKLMDLFMGVPSILMDNGEKRKQLYGKPGAFRDKPYGVEYRVLSNFWIFNDKTIEWVWNQTLKAVNAAEAQFTLSEQDSRDVVSCINNNDKELAHQLIKKFNLEVAYV